MTWIILGAVGTLGYLLIWFLNRPTQCPFCHGWNTSFNESYGRTYCDDCQKRIS